MQSVDVRRILCSLPLSLAVALAPTSALAEPEPAPRWYGWQTLTTDGAAFTLVLMGSSSKNSSTAGPLASLGAGTYFFGGPVVHAAHGNWGRAAGSLGLRIAAPMVGGVLGVSMADCRGAYKSLTCGSTEMALGILVGMTTAIVIDAAVLATDTEPRTPSVAPVVQVSRNGAWAGVSSRF